MAEAKPYKKRKLVCGIIAADSEVFTLTEKELQNLFGPVDMESDLFEFNETDYYFKQMGKVPLKRKFISFEKLVNPEGLSEIKTLTNHLEKKIKEKLKGLYRMVNIDPGILNSSSLIMATVKDFAHRIPLQQGIYGHLELLFRKDEVKTIPWTYPDFRKQTYHPFLLKARKKYLSQTK